MATPTRLEVVLVSYHFPPLAGMASNRAVRLVNELSDRGHRVTVVTGAGDPPLEGPTISVRDGVRVVRAGRHQLSAGIRAVRRVLPGAASGLGGTGPGASDAPRLQQWVRDWVYFPDAQIAWYPAAVRSCRAELARLDHPVLWTTAVPYTSHLVGRAVQRRTGVRWVAELRDPWARSQDAAIRSRRRVALDRRLERRVLRHPDALVFTTEATLDLFVGDHGESIDRRSHVVPNTWTRGEFMAPSPPGPDQPLRLVYAGSLNSVQDPRPLVAAIARVARDDPGGVELHVFGPTHGWPSSEVVTLHGPILPADVPSALSTASVLVMLAPGPHYRSILLGKTMDWLGSRQPCLGVLDPQGAMAALIEESHGGVICERNEPAQLEQSIRRLLDAHRTGTLARLRPDPTVADRFELRRVADRLEEALAGDA